MSKKEKDPYSLREIYKEMELELIASLRRNFLKHKIEEHAAGFSWEMWQKAKLRSIHQYQLENSSIIFRFKARIKQAIEDVLNHFYDKGYKSTVNIPKDGVNTARPGERPPKETQFFGTNKRKLDALIETSKKDFDNANHAVYRKMDDVYRQTIFNTEFKLSSGALSLGKAIDNAVEKFLDQGINCIGYKDKTGHIIRYVNIADYAEMALRTASHRATLLGEGAKRDELGVHLVFVSAHANSCKLCLPWQGQILIDDVFSHPSKEYIAKYKGKYKMLSEAIKAGLLHPNCRHTLATYFDGITRLPDPQDGKEALENYNNEQHQRKLEREIRKRKRILEGTVDEDNRKTARKRLNIAQKEMRDFLDKYPEFKRQSRREKVYDDNLGKLGNGGNDDILDQKGEYVETIDIKDVDKYIEKYENEIKDYPVEHAYVIHGNGKVMHYVGDDKGVSIPVKGVDNAVITHNHPIDPDIDENCFGADDFGYLQECGLKISKLRATYGDIRYEVRVLKDLSQLSFSEYRNKGSAMIDITADYIDMEENAYLLLAKEGYVEFTKTKTKVK